MPVYEFYCKHCDGIYEALRPMREAADPVPCPECERDGMRIMPTSFSAFTFREGYARHLPDRGTYWHLGKEVKQRIKGPFKPFEHPEVNKPTPNPAKSKGDVDVERDRTREMIKEAKKMRQSGVQPRPELFPKKIRPPRT
ncbi:MAG: zinc ribbon domain-containing protein [Dehalococcoidia bacterium]